MTDREFAEAVQRENHRLCSEIRTARKFAAKVVSFFDDNNLMIEGINGADDLYKSAKAISN